MRVACLLVEHLPTHVETRRNPAAAAAPLAVLRTWDGRVLDASPDVIAAGVGVGDSRRRLEQLCPQAIVLPADETAYQSHHDRLRDALAAFGGAVENGALGELFSDVTALARSFPSDKALALQLAAQAQREAHLPAAVGIAANKFTALQAARQATAAKRTLQGSQAVVVPTGDEAHFLAPLPLYALPDPPVEMLRRLHLLDITTLGGLARLPHAAAIRQLDTEAALFHDLARGIDPRPLAPQSPPPLVTRTLRLPDPADDRRPVLAALEHLAGQLARELERGGHHAQAISMVISRADGQRYTDGAAVKPPSADAARLRRLAGRLLGQTEFAAPVDALTLTAYPLRDWHMGARQLNLFEETASPRLRRLHEALRTLRQRFGEAVVCLASAIGQPLPLPIQVETDSHGAPLQLRWGGWSRRVTTVYESWREQCRWWDQPVIHDYYQVETAAVTAFTVFRDAGGCWFLDRRRE